MNGFSISVTIFGGLGLFLFGMKIMSESLQMAAGDRMKSILSTVTNRRIAGVFTGFIITSIIQSSSATTVMLVSFVSAGLITLQQSVGIIFGANIGTTVTGWLVAIFGFKVQIAAFALPAIGIGFFIRFLNNEKLQQYGEVLLGFGVLFLGLDVMSGAVKDLRGSEGVMSFMAGYIASSTPRVVLVVGIGTAITMLLQSSSATMAMTMTLAAHGLIDFQTACALILGENIGTTITANIAAVGASSDAKRAARIHLLFNLFGVCWVVTVFHLFFVPMVDYIVPGDPYTADHAARSMAVASHLAAFHTVFNICNTIVFFPFAGVLVKLATRMVPAGRGEDPDAFHLKYISTSLVSTPSININQARLEIRHMAQVVLEMFDMVMDVFHKPTDKLGTVVEEVGRKENVVDRLEKDISDFLVRVSQQNLSQEQSQSISAMLHMVNEMERMGDHCESLLRYTRRKYDGRIEFTEQAMKEIGEIAGKVREFIVLLRDNLMTDRADILPRAKVLEDRIDELRRDLKKGHVQRLNQGLCDVPSGLIFIDMLTSFEKIGDHAFNVAEGIAGERVF
ncbi:MAG: Na/Pi cotransporter family protein [Spirochaetota bacterium]